MKALILVDIQNDFVTGGALAVPQGEEIVPIVNGLQAYFDLIIATQDYHPANHGSFAENHEGKQIGETIDLNGLEQILWPVHCVQGSKGTEFVADLKMEKITKVFTKGTDAGIDSYSGFYDNGHKKSTGLADFLKERGVKEVYVTGLATDYCVKFTALDAVQEGFKTYLIKDATKGVNLQPNDVDQAIADMKTVGVKVVHSDDIS